MDQGIGWQPQAKVPPLLVQVVKQSLMRKATIGKQGDHLACGHDSTHLVQHRLVGFKTDLCASMAQGSPCYRDGATTIDEGGTDQHKGCEGRRIRFSELSNPGGPSPSHGPSWRSTCRGPPTHTTYRELAPRVSINGPV